MFLTKDILKSRNAHLQRSAFLFTIASGISLYGHAQDASYDSLRNDSSAHKTIHRIEAEVNPSLIFHTNEFLRGENPETRVMNHAFSARIKYAFQHPRDDAENALYPECYQGVGLAYHNFNHQLGNPVSAFLFQGAKIMEFSKNIALNYEWNLGLTMGWNPYDKVKNPSNRIIGSKVTAYINADFYINWRLSDAIDLNTGISLCHFSNGNTQLPNAGLNIGGAKVGIAYYINRSRTVGNTYVRPASDFQKHLSYDIMLFGSWRRKGYETDGTAVALPGTYAVCGFNFNPMYNFNPLLKAGISLDGSYDHSANLYISDYISGTTGDRIKSPSALKQMALGLSGRVEFVMPYFSINAGIGTNVINGTGDFKGVYQILALKIRTPHKTFIHIGYSLHDFKTPNYLMLGLGVSLP